MHIPNHCELWRNCNFSGTVNKAPFLIDTYTRHPFTKRHGGIKLWTDYAISQRVNIAPFFVEFYRREIFAKAPSILKDQRNSLFTILIYEAVHTAIENLRHAARKRGRKDVFWFDNPYSILS